MFYTIYKITNILNNKYYIGMHKTSNLNDGYMGSGKLIKRAIEKYGFKFFSKEYLFIFDNEEDMKNKEKELVILESNSYNLCLGGQGGFSYINSLPEKSNYSKKNVIKLHSTKKHLESLEFIKNSEILEKKRLDNLRKSLSSKENIKFTFAGKCHSVKTKKVMSEKAKSRIGIKNPSFGSFWITDGINNKKIKKEQLDFYITQGYYKGRV